MPTEALSCPQPQSPSSTPRSDSLGPLSSSQRHLAGSTVSLGPLSLQDDLRPPSNSSAPPPAETGSLARSPQVHVDVGAQGHSGQLSVASNETPIPSQPPPIVTNLDCGNKRDLQSMDDDKPVQVAIAGDPKGWTAMAKIAREHDQERVDDTKDDIDTLLVFVRDNGSNNSPTYFSE